MKSIHTAVLTCAGVLVLASLPKPASAGQGCRTLTKAQLVTVLSEADEDFASAKEQIAELKELALDQASPEEKERVKAQLQAVRELDILLRGEGLVADQIGAAMTAGKDPSAKTYDRLMRLRRAAARVRALSPEISPGGKLNDALQGVRDFADMALLHSAPALYHYSCRYTQAVARREARASRAPAVLGPALVEVAHAGACEVQRSPSGISPQMADLVASAAAPRTGESPDESMVCAARAASVSSAASNVRIVDVHGQKVTVESLARSSGPAR